MKYKFILIAVFFLGTFPLAGKACPTDSIGIRIIAGKPYILHKLDVGETLAKLSKRYACSVASILYANDLTSEPVAAGTVLKIPSPKAGNSLSLADYVGDTPATDGASTTSVVKPTVSKPVATNNAVTTSKPTATTTTVTSKPVASNNTVVSTKPVTSTTTKPAITTSVTPSATQSGNWLIHTVVSGETLFRLGIKYGVSVNAIKANNNMSTDQINIGQKLKIKLITPAPVNDSHGSIQNTDDHSDQSSANLVTPVNNNPNATTVSKPVNTLPDNYAAGDVHENVVVANTPVSEETIHVVKQGETLSLIASTYKTTVAEIKRLNGLSSDLILVGQKLKVPVKGTTTTTYTPAAVKPTTNAVTNYHEPEPLIKSLTIAELPKGDTLKHTDTFPELSVITVKETIPVAVGAISTPYTDPYSQKSFLNVTEKGKMGLIDDYNTDQTRFYVFHKSLPIGSYVRVDYPKKNQSILAEVVGTIGASNPNIILMTSHSAESLMIKSAGEEVEIRYVIPQ